MCCRGEHDPLSFYHADFQLLKRSQGLVSFSLRLQPAGRLWKNKARPGQERRYDNLYDKQQAPREAGIDVDGPVACEVAQGHTRDGHELWQPGDCSAMSDRRNLADVGGGIPDAISTTTIPKTKSATRNGFLLPRQSVILLDKQALATPLEGV